MTSSVLGPITDSNYGLESRLREVKASRDVVNAILVYPSPSEERRPLEVIKGLELVEPRSGTGMCRATMKLVGAHAS